MYNVKLDENKYFTGSYAKVGKVQGGIDVPTLPPNMSKATCYKYGPYEITEEIDVPVLDEETGEQKLDKEGNFVCEKKEVVKTIVGWQFDADRDRAFKQEDELEKIREARAMAFQEIDKYQLVLVYQSLTEEQKEELATYRQAWLDAPETKSMPVMPIWLEE